MARLVLKMELGKVRGKFRIQRREAGQWVTVSTVHCKKTFLRGGEKVVAGRLAGVNTVVLRFRRYRSVSEIRTSWRLKSTLDDQVFDVQSFITSEDRRWVDVTCTVEAD